MFNSTIETQLSGEMLMEHGHSLAPSDVFLLTPLEAPHVRVAPAAARDMTVLRLNGLGISGISAMAAFVRASPNTCIPTHTQFRCVNLVHLSLRHNALQDVAALGALKRLETLDVAHNYISNLAVASSFAGLKRFASTSRLLSH